MYAIHRPLALTLSAGLGLLALASASPDASAFTQNGVSVGFGSAIPMGHEWITRLSALELLGGDPIMQPDA